MKKSNYNVSVTDNTISSAGESGYRARQNAHWAREERLRRSTNPYPNHKIPIVQGIFNLIVAAIIALLFWSHTSKNPPIIRPHTNAAPAISIYERID